MLVTSYTLARQQCISNMRMLPVFLNLSGKKCLVVGGGEVAYRKVLSLLDTGAHITVVALSVVEGLLELADSYNNLSIKIRRYLQGEAAEHFIIFAATDKPEINKLVRDDAQAAGRLVNSVDDPPNCNFYSAAVVQRGDLQIAVSSKGRAPALAKKIKKDIDSSLNPRYAELIDLLDSFRTDLKDTVASVQERMDIMNRIIESDAIDTFLDGNSSPLEELLRTCR